MIITIYTDGSCLKNPGPGGYSFIMVNEKREVLRVYGYEKNATNNMMELKAIICALKHLIKSPFGYLESIRRPNLKVIIKSDSAYCIRPINENWIGMWKLNEWKTSQNKEVKNKELWKELILLLKKADCNIIFEKVKGHSGDKYNEIADKLAKKGALIAQEELKK